MNWTRGHTIGHGSSAMVSIATSHGSDEIFAVKSIEFAKSKFLQREQKILSSLSCPQIVKYMGHDITMENGKLMYNLFMEYISRGTLSDEIQKQGGLLDESSIRSHTRSILQGLEYLHSNHIVHCDIKGRNVLIGSDGAKIADLGCARFIVDSSISIAGTPVFMAPEVARGEEQGCPADIWALGCTIIEMATGFSPWPDVTDPVCTLYRIGFSRDVPEFPSSLSEQATDFLCQCLRRDPKERWTAYQLLKHPFIEEPKYNSKQIQGSSSNSPISVLDQDFMNAFKELETHQSLLHIGSSNSPAERIRLLCHGRLSSSPRLPNWTWYENWIDIRSNKNGEESENSSGTDHIWIHSIEPDMTKWSFIVWISHEKERKFNDVESYYISSCKGSDNSCRKRGGVMASKFLYRYQNFKKYNFYLFTSN